MSEVKQIEEHIKELKRGVAKRDKALKLYNNREFKELILDGFCVQDAAKYVQQAGDPILTAEERADALAIAMAAGHLKRFLSITVQMGNNCESQLKRSEEELELARSEEGEV